MRFAYARVCHLHRPLRNASGHGARQIGWHLPGPYAYCELPPESFYLVVGAALPAAGACTEGYLPPGGVLRLAAPGG
ncbi:MAG TPA: hypothetical protein PKX99_06010 [Thermoanaerobaculia bacterium]|nr:hypothetical protein [Thermoanaerobaculia bacterium]